MKNLTRFGAFASYSA